LKPPAVTYQDVPVPGILHAGEGVSYGGRRWHCDRRSLIELLNAIFGKVLAEFHNGYAHFGLLRGS